MTNWIAGHTDRFGAIVTHAGLWALDQQHATTDAAHYKTGIFGTLAEHPEWYAENSPHNSVDAIRTPMLVVHGNRDYRVPVSEALRLWWDLVSRWDGRSGRPAAPVPAVDRREPLGALAGQRARSGGTSCSGFCAAARARRDVDAEPTCSEIESDPSQVLVPAPFVAWNAIDVGAGACWRCAGSP